MRPVSAGRSMAIGERNRKRRLRGSRFGPWRKNNTTRPNLPHALLSTFDSTNNSLPASSVCTHTRASSSSLLCSRRTTCNPLFNCIVARSTRARYNASQASIETLSACGQTVSGGARYDYARFPTIISPASDMITHTHPRMSNGCNAN